MLTCGLLEHRKKESASMYDIKAKFTKNSPLPCWKGYERVPGTAQGAKGSCRKSSPAKVTQKGGGTKKVCLPKAKIASMSQSERQKVVRAKRAAGKAGKYRRSSKSNVTGTSSGGSLKTWVKQDWRQVGNPSKKCGEK
jgi:hypothetical protein